MSIHVFVDNSNIWIEGKYASAVSKGWVSNIFEAHNRAAKDSSWRIDFGKLLEFVVDGKVEEVSNAVLFGSKPPESDSLWSRAEVAGFEVNALDRNVLNKEKAVDTGIVQKIDKCLYREAEEGDTFILVAGDKDFIHSIRAIKEEKMIAKVAFWDNVSAELSAEADEFLDLTPHITKITY